MCKQTRLRGTAESATEIAEVERLGFRVKHLGAKAVIFAEDSEAEATFDDDDDDDDEEFMAKRKPAAKRAPPAKPAARKRVNRVSASRV